MGVNGLILVSYNTAVTKDVIEKVQLDFCKRVLGVKKSTCNVMIYSELGRLPLHVIRKFKVLKYLVKILSTDNCILQQCYQEMLINRLLIEITG